MNAERLKLARKRAGLSLRALADKTGGIVSAQGIGHYEAGRSRPGSQILIALSKALDVAPSFLMSASGIRLGRLDFRKKSITKASERAAVQAEILDVLERYITIEEIVGAPETAWNLPEGFPFRVETLEDAERAAEKLRVAWDLGHDPIPDMVELMEEHGIKVIVRELPASVDGITCEVERPGYSPVRAIACNKSKGIERRRSTLAHELGHAVLDIPVDIKEEKACQRFAGAFLAPAVAVRREFGGERRRLALAELMLVKRLLGISASALVYRLKDLKIIAGHEYERFSMSPQGRSWRKIEPEPLTCEDCNERPSRFLRLVMRALAEEMISTSKASELLGISVHDVRLKLVGAD